MHHKRPLDRIEVKWLHEQAAQVYTYRGVLDEKLLARAYESLCVRHPVLNARISHDGDGYYLEARDDDLPKVHARRGDLARLREEIGELPDPADGVARLNLVTDATGGAIVLQTYLFVVDGQSWLALFAELWSRYTRLVTTGALPTEETGALPVPPSTVLERLGIPCDYRPSPSVVKPIHQIDRILDPDVVTGLRTVAHRAGTTVHGLLCGAMLLVHRRLDPLPGEWPMLCMSAVNLRHRLTAPVGKLETTRLVGWHRTDLTVRGDEDPVPLGRQVRDQLTKAIEAHEVPLMRPPMDPPEPLDPRLSSVVTTNMAVIPEMEFPPDLEVTGTSRLYPCTALDTPWHGFYTFQGRMTIMSAYPTEVFSVAEGEGITRRITEVLADIAATA
ncbi:hypothetical protein FHX82_005761 [Amycolatopsis bartoniae]|uniref:Phthiocerol/phthiodiolone dimycocerosyl transferase n=1 Tax=Amycolatopsis bartoniae TaxID=941986 RepID=A0A8H9J5B3_9PSEU|nr:hypothetical protein [Amycolatopsis bartoniae]MBB2938683.1 hypothetical protein [Amycolatopsis bartoniae]TVT11529.1 hypothetical protein FNH07_01530 [Amycolatopsis bartoniae]GHF79399.1 hypothetical protein GCM10017566_61970 [Amycolatopsis bartoniae]